MAFRRKYILGILGSISQAVKDFIERVVGDGGIVESPKCIDSYGIDGDFCMIPSGYKPEVLFSQKPVPVYGNELVVNGGFDTDTDWTKGVGVTISGGSANFAGNPNANINQDSGLVIGTKYKAVFTVSNYISGSIDINVGGNTRQGSYTANGNYTVDVVCLGGSSLYFQEDASVGFEGSIDNVSVKEVLTSSGDFTVDRNSLATRVNAQGLIEEVGVNIPRLDYSDGSCPVLLTEPQSTNLITYSEDFGQLIWNSGISGDITPNQNTSPDGLNNFTKLFSTAETPADHRLRYTPSMVINTDYAVSVYIKKDDVQYYYFRDLANGDISIIDIDTNVITLNGAGHTVKITDFNNGVKKIDVSFATVGTISNNLIDFGMTSSPTNYVSQISIGSGNYIWGAQLEQLSYPTSYIPTQGTTVTRLGDIVKDAGDVNSFNSEEGVLYVEISSLEEQSSTNKFIQINDGTTSNAITIYYEVGANKRIVGRAWIGGVTVTLNSNTNLIIKDFKKVAFKYKGGEYALWIDGIEHAVSTSALTMPINTLNTLSFYQSGSGNPFYGKTKALKVFKTALTDTQLTELTTTGSVTPIDPLLPIANYPLAISSNEIGGTTLGINGVDTAITYDGIEATFNGTTSFIEIPDNDIFSFTDGLGNDKPFTIEFTVNLVNLDNVIFINKRGNAGTDVEWQIDYSGGNLRIILFSGGTSSNQIQKYHTITLPLNTDIKLTYIYDGSGLVSGLKLLVDDVDVGLESSVGTYVGMSNTSATVVVGKAGWTNLVYLNGTMKSLKLYNHNVQTPPSALLVFDGDSLTRGFNNSGIEQYYPNEIVDEINLSKTTLFYSFGISSQALFTMLLNAPTKIYPLSFSGVSNVLILWAGANDILAIDGGSPALRTAQQTFDNAEAYFLGATGYQYKIIITGYNPRKNGSGDYAIGANTITPASVAEYEVFLDLVSNADVSSQSWTHNIDLRDAPNIGGGIGQLENPTYFADYLHLQTAGYDIVASEVETVVKSILNI